MSPTDPGPATIQCAATRAERKAHRRAEIRDVAQHLFDQRGFDAVTIADIAATASVSVQTVFNHFAAKEDLFFDGRTPWVDGPARAVQSRPWDVPPLTALREHLVRAVRETVYLEATPPGRRYTAAIQASPALSAQERELVHQAQHRLCAALTMAWTDDSRPSAASLSDDPTLLAGLTSVMWLAAAREIVLAQRPLGSPPDTRAGQAAALTDYVLHRLSQASSALTSLPAGMCDGG